MMRMRVCVLRIHSCILHAFVNTRTRAHVWHRVCMRMHVYMHVFARVKAGMLHVRRHSA